jgi:hypothetical protein
VLRRKIVETEAAYTAQHDQAVSLAAELTKGVAALKPQVEELEKKARAAEKKITAVRACLRACDSCVRSRCSS